MTSDHLLLPANVQNSWRQPSPVNIAHLLLQLLKPGLLCCAEFLRGFVLFFLLCCVQWPELAQIRHSHTHKIGKKMKKISRAFAVCFLSREMHASYIPLVQLTVACLLISLDGWESLICSGLQQEISGSPSRDHLQTASAIFILKLTRLHQQPNNPGESW